MFDVGFWEMAFIGVVALVVIGPEKLPKVARTAGLWMGKGRRMINDVKSDIKQEMNEDDLKAFRDLKGEVTSAKDNVKNMADSASESFGIKEAAEDLKSTIDAAKTDVSKDVEMLNESGLADSSASSDAKGAKKPVSKKTAKKKTKKNTAKKAAPKKTTPKKVATKKSTAKKASAKKSAPKKTTPKKTDTVKSETVATVSAETLKE